MLDSEAAQGLWWDTEEVADLHNWVESGFDPNLPNVLFWYIFEPLEAKSKLPPVIPGCYAKGKALVLGSTHGESTRDITGRLLIFSSKGEVVPQDSWLIEHKTRVYVWEILPCEACSLGNTFSTMRKPWVWKETMGEDSIDSSFSLPSESELPRENMYVPSSSTCRGRPCQCCWERG